MKKADDLYVMANSLLPGVYKVGRAADPHKRAQSLMASQPFRVKALVTFPEFGFLERAVHKSLEHFRVRSGPGVEWFKCSLHLIVSCVLTRLPTYFSQVVTERSWHAVEGVDGEVDVLAATPAAGSSLSGDGVSS
ncbi:MAG: GIY-YIG nuclease family protein, partial [Acidobacteria bacterium]|nr:GIY-YIG nuclease family protein [Acidobacteriota bacterium]